MHISYKPKSGDRVPHMRMETFAQAFYNAAGLIDKEEMEQVIIKDGNVTIFNYTNGEILAGLPEQVVQGDIFSTHLNAIAHGVNCQGVMGAGIALEVKRRYPEAYNGYVRYLNRYDPMQYIAIGTMYPYPVPGTNLHILNCFTQVDTAKQRGEVAISYQAIFTSFSVAGVYCKENGIKELAVPQVGAGLGGGEWKIIYQLIANALDFYGVTPIVYVLPTRGH